MRNTHLVFFTATLLSMPTLRAQGQDLESFSEAIDVRVLNLEVAVTDKEGRHIDGLRPEDFRLIVDGNVVPIEYFSEIRYGASVATELPDEIAVAATDTVETVPSVAPGEVVGNSFLLFVDDYFGVARDRNIVLENILDTVPRLGPKDRMAIVSFDGSKLDLVGNWETSHQRDRKKPAARRSTLADRRADNARPSSIIYELQLRGLGAGLDSRRASRTPRSSTSGF